MSERLNFTVSLFAALCFFLVGLLWSTSTWRHGFDMGWLVVAFCVARSVSARIESSGTSLEVKNYALMLWPAVPAFVLEGLAGLSLRKFSEYGRPEEIVQFALLSCLFLVFIAAATAVCRFGIGMADLPAEDYSISRRVVYFLSLTFAIFVTLGTPLLFIRTDANLSAQLTVLQSWFYKLSLLAYFLLSIKMMLPILLKRFRAASEARGL